MAASQQDMAASHQQDMAASQQDMAASHQQDMAASQQDMAASHQQDMAASQQDRAASHNQSDITIENVTDTWTSLQQNYITHRLLNKKNIIESNAVVRAERSLSSKICSSAGNLWDSIGGAIVERLGVSPPTHSDTHTHTHTHTNRGAFNFR
eukprot:GHVR01130364.1.p1 GENE.GHVR01130364.1~~GHVR01130364.1.p1  ORF type:complete len:152 (-),score=85.23 GHVR01130364.1:10-465(-)